MSPQTIHLPTVISDLFGISRSEARWYIAQGGVKVKGQVTTDLDVDLESLPGSGPVGFELGFSEVREMTQPRPGPIDNRPPR